MKLSSYAYAWRELQNRNEKLTLWDAMRKIAPYKFGFRLFLERIHGLLNLWVETAQVLGALVLAHIFLLLGILEFPFFPLIHGVWVYREIKKVRKERGTE